MEWHDDAIILTVRPHGETAAIVTMLSPQHGRYAGLVAGGQGRAARAALQPGNTVSAFWQARVADNLGYFRIELINNRWARWLENRLVLTTIASATVVSEVSLPERHPVPTVYAGLAALLDITDATMWGLAYVKWEVELLRHLGYGLELERCAVTGSTDNLTHVSPRSGRAVCAEAARPYLEKLLPLPGFLVGRKIAINEEDDGGGDSIAKEVLTGLNLTGHFLSRHIFSNPQNQRLVPKDAEMPTARQLLLNHFRNLKTA